MHKDFSDWERFEQFREPQYRHMPLPFGFSKRLVAGGPYRDKPEDYIGIKVAAELRDTCAMHVPIRDFGVPMRPDQMKNALAFAMDRIAEGEPVYVGCMGGIGRTGLFLSLLVKALTGWDGEQAIEYVRAYYCPPGGHLPVERPEQEAYVVDFDVSELRAKAKAAKWKAFFHDVWGFFGVKPKY